MRALLLAPQTRPGGTGEEYWGFMLAKGLSERVDATVITLTPDHFDGSIAAHLPRARVFERPKWPLYKVSERLNAIAKPNYLNFYFFASKVIRDLLKTEHFDVAHQFGPLGLRYPTPLARFPVPYVLGPLGGSLPTPIGFRADEKALPLYYSLRSLDTLRMRHDPILRKSFERAQTVVGVGAYVKEVLGNLQLKDFRIQAQTAINQIPELTKRTSGDTVFRLLCVGRVIRTKGLIYVIEALGRHRDVPNWHLDAIGDGDDLALCRERAEALGIAQRITFHGHLPRPTIDEFYRNADLFLFPSFREPSGGVVLEAMSFGLPMIIADYGGPPTLVSQDCAIKISVESPERMTREMAEAISFLWNNPPKIEAMSKSARAYAEQTHLWRSRYDFFESLYKDTMHPATPKPGKYA